ncbi:hypothetical protein LCGC14_1296630 [marine sediment metagenome]|uniref:GIY-YIG domain-containing protein n=1 Tax=marine sediment metagenome TaxID=412755 RepID=A0A0F9N7B7_9ZZZZ|nr:GIY-YIG nuclease family protein [Pricia sp.]
MGNLRKTPIISEVTYIYALADPRSGEIRYVGKSNVPKRRLYNHKTTRFKDNKLKNMWLRELYTNGMNPEIKALECCKEDRWEEKEKEWISFFGLENLVNALEGGQGGLNGHLGPSKLTQNEVQEIKICLAVEEPAFKIAKKFNISVGTIRAIHRNLAWKYVKPDVSSIPLRGAHKNAEDTYRDEDFLDFCDAFSEISKELIEGANELLDRYYE